MSPVKFIGVLTTFVFALITVSVISNAQSVSAAAPIVQAQREPLEIEPICSSEPRAVSEWKVTNKNASTVSIKWDNFENSLSGVYAAPAGQSVMTTGYVAADPNNTTKFTYVDDGSLLGQTNATKAACAEVVAPAPTCVDGTKHDNLVAKYVAANSVAVSTKDNALLCEDVVLYFSSYKMPRGYDGKGFNSTAYPQTIHDSVRIVLKKDTNGLTLAVVDFPKCENVQFDLYYGPEITTVGANGHGAQNILSNVILRDKKKCDSGPTTPTTPTPPSEPQTPAAPAETPGRGAGMGAVTANVEETKAEALPEELPETGPSDSVPYMIIGMILAVLTYLSLYAVQTRRS